jgi:hypothetical protein
MFETCNLMYFKQNTCLKHTQNTFQHKKRKKKSVLEAPKGKTNIYMNLERGNQREMVIGEG